MLPLWCWSALCLLLFIIVIIGRKYFPACWLFRTELSGLRVWPVILLQFAALGAIRYALQQPNWTDADLAWYNDQGSYMLSVVVDKSPDRRENAVYYHVSVFELYDPSGMTYRRIDGSALVKTTAATDWQLGDVLRFTASPKTPSESEDFSYRDYLERSGIYTVIYYPTSVEQVGSGRVGWFATTLEWLRGKASKTIFTILPQPESGLLAGILLGNDNDLPDSLNQAYRDTGTAHVIAISGFNMVLLTRLMTLLISRFLSKRRTMLVTATVLIVYTVFVGASPSVVRAAVMAIFAFGGDLVGRRHAGLNGLGLTAGVMLAFNPLLPWDASFQLSFLATLGMLLFAGPLQDWLTHCLENRFSEATAARLQGPINEYLLSSLAAQVMTLPVIALQFHRLSLSSLLANPLVLPVQPAILVLGGLSTLAGMLWLPLGRVIGALTWPLLAWSNGVAQVLSTWQWGAFTLSDRAAVVVALTCAFIVLLFLIRNYFMKIFSKINWLYMTVLLILAAGLIFTIAARQPDGYFHISLIRAGDGTALFLRSPEGNTLLIDPGGSPNELSSTVSREISPWNFHVDAVLLTNRGTAKGLESLVDRLPLRLALLTRPVWQVSDTNSAVTLPEGLAAKQLGEYEIVEIEGGLTIQPIADDNEHTALLVIYGNTRILIPGGVSPELLRASPADNLSSLSVLILNEEDTANLPTDMWQNFGAQVILWNSTAVSPDPAWMSLDRSDCVEIISDGIFYK